MTWDIELGHSRNWPGWFLEYRRADDAVMREKIAAVLRGEMTEDDYTAWVMKSVEDYERWRESLRPEQRAWLDEQEEVDRAYFVPPELLERLLSRIDKERVRAAPEPLLEYFRLLNTLPTCEEDLVREYLQARRAAGKGG